jgi:RNA polymerase-binding transcription factor DksA
MRTKKKEKQRLKAFEDLLDSRLVELRSHVEQLRQEIVIEEEADDEPMQASRTSNREFVMITMEREMQNISEIQQALERIAKNAYGVCITCEEQFPINDYRPYLGRVYAWTVQEAESTETLGVQLADQF